MMDNVSINPLQKPASNMIYAYTMPGVEYLEGWIKIGQTSKTAQERIAEQTATAGIRTRLEWQDYALYKDGSGQEFTDRQFHAWLVNKNGIEQLRENGKPRELFHLDVPASRAYFEKFASRGIPVNSKQATFVLRREQQEAIDKTRAWFESGEEEQEFLWNAKPRFGKTLTSYALVQQMDFKKVLVVSNRPSISNSWAEDFYKFISWQKQYLFVSDNDALKRRPGVLTRKEFLAADSIFKKFIAFESLQGLKNSLYFGGSHDTLKWINDLEFDLLIVDESHEGVDTLKTERAFDNIKRKHTLYLSGTPFRQLASAQFEERQIFNWSYADEQKAKKSWSGAGPNPYERLPRLCLFTCQMSEIIRDKAQKGIIISEGYEPVDYAFDLNEFFKTTDSGKFAHEEDVKKFIRALTSQEKYPFSTPQLRKNLSHTMWYLNRVASAKALKKLLKEDEVFKDYEIIVAAGNERDESAPDLKAFERVKKAIASHEKTITLTVGQLTTGVTIPEWSAVLMLCSLQSPAAYMQAAFRAQNPYYELDGDELLLKENAYVFDFDPARTLVIIDEFANNLSLRPVGGGTGDERQTKIKQLLNFLPVIGEDPQGRMVELDAEQVLTIPRRLKSQEVVKHGFMSNFLFQNIGNVFAAPEAVRKILEKLPLASEERRKPKPGELKKIGDIPVDDKGEVSIPEKVAIGQAQEMFGEKIYGIIEEADRDAETILAGPENCFLPDKFEQLGKLLKTRLMEKVIKPVGWAKGLKKSALEKIAKANFAEIDRKISKIAGGYERERKIAEVARAKEQEKAVTESERREAEERYETALESAAESAKTELQETIRQTLENKPAAVIKEAETAITSAEKGGIENGIRAHLRGFARTIPSFIMAYGDENLKLANFDQYVSSDVFQDVTGISMENFLFLRDGGEYENEVTGKKEQFAGHLFDEAVFNDAIREFLAKRDQLKDYFREEQEEDIFDYIPPQKTSQIFTPRRIVSLMADRLEQENPGCFDDPDKTFADLYMKSGLYITEIVKRLFRSKGLKKAYPDENARIRHILSKQVYGLAPNEIIYRIAVNYILGFDDNMKNMNHNFRQGDAVKAAKAGKLEELAEKSFSKQ